MQNLDLLLIGFGHVGRAFAELLEQKQDLIRSTYQLNVRIVGILTGNHGGALDPAGIDTAEAVRLLDLGKSLEVLSRNAPPNNADEFIRTSGAHAMLENTPVNYASGQPAIDHLQTALKSGMHAITANKGPVVHAYQLLTKLAKQHKRKFFFESTVMDGAPIFSLWRSSLPAAKLSSFRGILNSTTNLVLTLMEQGNSFEQAVQTAQDLGIAETDPSGDLDGWDAAVKVAALTTVLMEHPLLPDEVDREGISRISADEIERAREHNQRWKLVCEAQRTEQGVRTSVKPQALDPEDPLFNVMGTSSAVTFQSDVLGALTLLEENPGPHTTAYGLLADLLNSVSVQRE
ncbi:MAG: homoserine dehydrogenase [Anaerolineales bacterium]|jgi:homoserine dehydrogenase